MKPFICHPSYKFTTRGCCQIASVVGAILVHASVQGAVLGSLEGNLGPDFNQSYGSFWFGETPDFFPPFPDRHATVFDDLRLTPADIGRTFVTSVQDSPDAASLASLLTNGRADGVGYVINNGGSLTGVESVVFRNRPADAGPADFQGYRIEGFSLEILELWAVSPGGVGHSDPTMGWRLGVHGVSVPEPRTWGLLAAAAAAVVGWNLCRAQCTTCRG